MAAPMDAAVNPMEDYESDGTNSHLLRRKAHGQTMIGTLWAQLAAVRCYEGWKDFVWQRQAFEWNRDRFELARLERLQVRCLLFSFNLKAQSYCSCPQSFWTLTNTAFHLRQTGRRVERVEKTNFFGGAG